MASDHFLTCWGGTPVNVWYTASDSTDRLGTNTCCCCCCCCCWSTSMSISSSSSSSSLLVSVLAVACNAFHSSSAFRARPHRSTGLVFSRGYPVLTTCAVVFVLSPPPPLPPPLLPLNNVLSKPTLAAVLLERSLLVKVVWT